MTPSSRFLLLLTLFLIGNCIEEEEDDIKTTMEQFSGYPAAADPSHSIPPVDSLALQQQIDELSTFSDSPAPSVTRISYTHNDVLARRFIKNLMGRAGLSVREDAVGNIFGRCRLLAGSVSFAKALTQTVDNANISFLDAAKSAGYAGTEDFSSMFLEEKSYSAFVELHIEQGPILENKGISIGIVTAIAAPASIKVDFGGNGGHTGAVLMPQRNDAVLAAAELALAVEKHVLESGSVDTVGRVDTRDIDEKRRNTVLEKVHESAVSISKRRGVELLEFKIVNQDPPALSDESVINAMESAAQLLGLSHKKMISRAYHDSLFMARKAPMGMIFIPCYKGYSHKPEEYASPEDIANGVKVLALTLAKLSINS